MDLTRPSRDPPRPASTPATRPRRLRRLAGAFLLGTLAFASLAAGASKEFDAALAKARKGDADAQYRVGEMYDLGQGVRQDYREAVTWYRRAAERNDARAQFALAEMYKNGDGVAKDMAQAVAWYRRAAANGSADAELLLGVLHEGGVGVATDFGEAARWYRRSAEQGDARAQMLLANLYRTGQGVPRSTVRAYALYTASIGRDAVNNPSIGHRAALAATMTAEQLEAGRQLAQRLSVPGKLGAELDAAP